MELKQLLNQMTKFWAKFYNKVSLWLL